MSARGTISPRSARACNLTVEERLRNYADGIYPWSTAKLAGASSPSHLAQAAKSLIRFCKSEGSYPPAVPTSRQPLR
jgi:hypothetical protein